MFTVEKLIILCFNLSLILSYAQCFGEESIFDDEDIYRQALPPTNTTGMTAPGTKWCGPGNTAANYNDLGTQRETDMCCRDHDHCEDIIESQKTVHGIENTDWFPTMKCSCEQKFLNCLQSVNNYIANTLGHIYFATKKHCVELGHPIVNCKEFMSGTVNKRCILYNVDTNQEKLWQLYDLPFYTTPATGSNKI